MSDDNIKEIVIAMINNGLMNGSSYQDVLKRIEEAIIAFKNVFN